MLSNNEQCHYIRYLNEKKLMKHSLPQHFSIIFAGWCPPYKTPALVSQRIWTPFSTVLFF